MNEMAGKGKQQIPPNFSWQQGGICVAELWHGGCGLKAELILAEENLCTFKLTLEMLVEN